tara:strand:+ start:735 stop:1253 length:519 start_codon:yes stop_codon:yes gene_type:complete
MAQDEGRFGRISRPVRCWAPLPLRPVVGSQIVREYVYAYTAVCPENGKMSSLILPYANTDMMNIFLKQVSDDFDDYFIIMQVDGASWHRSKKLNIPENIRLIQQPSYSPELNPVEHIWDDIREKEFSNRLFDSIESVIDCLCIGINRLSNSPEYLKSLTGFPHITSILCNAN